MKILKAVLKKYSAKIFNKPLYFGKTYIAQVNNKDVTK